MFSVIRVRFYY